MPNSNNSKQASTPTAQLGQALGLGWLHSNAPGTANALAAWASGQATGRRGITVQGAYYAATALAQAITNGPVTPGQVAAVYMAAGGVAPGRGNAAGYGAAKRLTLMHSAYYGANKHLSGTGVQHGPGTTQGAPTYTVAAPVLAMARSAGPVVLGKLAKVAQQHLTAYSKQACGCTGAKQAPCGTPRKVGAGTIALAKQPAKAPAKVAAPASTTPPVVTPPVAPASVPSTPSSN